MRSRAFHFIGIYWRIAIPRLLRSRTSRSSISNGRLRPTLGVTCSGDRTDVHIVTGGTALVDPQTSGHVVHLTFDDGSEQTQQWTAANDMQALFAPVPREIAYQIKQSTSLSFGFSHYMSGPIVVEFDLRGADVVIDSMAEPCGWAAD